MTNKGLLSFAFFALLVAGLVGGRSAEINPAIKVGATGIVRAHFNSNGRIILPVDYRSWTLIGTRIKVGGVSILDGLPLKVPEIFNVFVEPSAMKSFEKTGAWPDGAQIVKEMSTIETGSGCDEKTFICDTPLGIGVFQATYDGLGMMVKDDIRFPDAPGYWGYFGFGHHPLPYDRSSTIRPAAQCAACHVNLASKTDYVITQAHLGLTESDGN